MIVCAKCNRALRPKKNGVPFVEMAEDRPYKLWMADLWECQDCGAMMLHTSPSQQPVAEHYQGDFQAKLQRYDPKFQAKDFAREARHGE